MQRRHAVAGPGVYIGPVGEQQLRHILVTVGRRPVQSRCASPVLAEHQIGMNLEHCLDLCQVALRGRATKLASEIVSVAGGCETDQSQSEEHTSELQSLRHL